MCEFRKLRANELQCKTTDTKFKGSATILIFKDARVDMKVLDETVTPMRWQKDYKEIDGKVYCGVAIKSKDTGEWIWKWDCGTEGNFEAEKSEASDAFKRACFAWGLGRELYDTPKIKIKCNDSYYYNDKLTMTFTVKSIEWEDNTLVDLVIVDRFGKVVYDYRKGGTNIFNGQDNTSMRVPEAPKVEKTAGEQLIDFCKQAKADGADQEILKKYYNYYKDKVASWNGRFDAKSLWDKWVAREKKPYNSPTKEDATIQEYEEHNLGADDESNYY